MTHIFGKKLRLLVILLVVVEPQNQTFGSSQKDSENKDGWSWGRTVAIGTATVAAGVGAVVAAPVILAGAGFTAGGVVAGSLAASVQAGIGGNVVAGSAFAALQSAGAAGIGGFASAVLGVGGATAGAVTTDRLTRGDDSKPKGT